MSFDLKIGFSCNNNCVHCVVADKRPKGNLSIPKLFRIIENVPKGIPITITGGEPTIYSYLPDILKKCHDENHKTIIQTNGTGFSDKEFFDKCSPYLDMAHVAIHSCNPDIHDSIVGSKGMWEKTIQGFKNLLDAGIYCTTQTVVSKYNIDTVYDTFKFIQKIAPGTQMSMTYPHLMGNAYENREEVAFRYSDKKDVIQRVLKDFASLVFTESIPPCYLYPYHKFVVGTQEMDIVSNSYRMGIDFSDSMGVKDYNYLGILEHRKAPRCKECIFNTNCIGVWKEYIELFHNNLDLYPIKDK